MKQDNNCKQTSTGSSLINKDAPAYTVDENFNQLHFNLQEITSISMEAIHIIDFQKRGFVFVENRDFFLNGFSIEEVMKLGFDFFPKVLHTDDLVLLKEIYAAIEQHKQLDEIYYFTFALRIKNELANYIMVDYKLIPKLIDGQLRYGFCMLASSVLVEPGHLQAHYSDRFFIDEYNPDKKKWEKKKKNFLTQKEKSVLILAKQGITNRQIAFKLGYEEQYVKNIFTSIYQKLNVNSNIQAINIATHHHLIFVPEPDNLKKPNEILTNKKERRPMTIEKLQRIQKKLNRGESMNSIAKQEDVSEFTIRYAKKNR